MSAPQVNIHVKEGEFDYTVFITNRSDLPATMQVDFGESNNLRLSPQGPSKQVGPLQIELTAAAGCDKVVIATLDHIQRNGNVKFHYKTRMMQSSAEEDDEVVNVAEGLQLVVRSTETGYRLFVHNENPTTAYEVVVDIGESTNLKLTTAPGTKSLAPLVVSGAVGPKTTGAHLGDADVADMSKGECEIKYRVRARPTQ